MKKKIKSTPKTLYPKNKERFLLIMEQYTREGATLESIASSFGVTRNTLLAWIKKYPELEEARERGLIPVEIQVENALLSRALGYKSKNFERVKGVQGDKYSDYTIEKDIDLPPDPASCMFWLKMRNAKRWREEKEEKEVQGNITIHIGENYE